MMKIWDSLSLITEKWSILQDRLPIDDMLADRFYVYLVEN